MAAALSISAMTKKIHCPFHKDDTASLVVYPNGYYCFGCGAKGDIRELNKHFDGKIVPTITHKRSPLKQDTGKIIEHIKSLPQKAIRGHSLHYDANAYYLVYPENTYYLKRAWEISRGIPKYRYPSGVKKPLYWAKKSASNTLYVVEGQFNALSLALLEHKADVVSPGSCTELIRPEYIQAYLQYKTVHVIVDKDPAGVVAGLQLRESLTKSGILATLTALEKDINKLHEEATNLQTFAETVSKLIP